MEIVENSNILEIIQPKKQKSGSFGPNEGMGNGEEPENNINSVWWSLRRTTGFTRGPHNRIEFLHPC